MPDHARELAAVHGGIARYYTATATRHGATPLGADWTCAPSQKLRFVQLLKLCDVSAPFSLDDVGCGYGALLAFLGERHPDTPVDYLGIDLSPAMIALARRLWRGRFVLGAASPRRADYSVASGIFNVRLEQPVAVWERFVADAMARMRATSRLGFAVNFMAPPGPGHPCRPGLYCTAPGPWVEHCERELDAQASVLTGYGLREFTLLIRPRPT